MVCWDGKIHLTNFFLFINLYLVFWPELVIHLYIKVSSRELYTFIFLEQILVCAYTIHHYGQILIFCTILVDCLSYPVMPAFVIFTATIITIKIVRFGANKFWKFPARYFLAFKKLLYNLSIYQLIDKVCTACLNRNLFLFIVP